MAYIIGNTITFNHCRVPQHGNLGTKGNSHIVSGGWKKVNVSTPTINHFLQQHTIFDGNDVIVLDEEDWPENQ